VLDRSLPPASEITARMRAGGVETRRWWGQGCHAQPAFAKAPRADLSVTNDLASRAIGLPFHLGLKSNDLATIASVLTDALVSDARTMRVSAAS
jgi:dTDP-4-amino-4,6-dideoxygalactose transaminase